MNSLIVYTLECLSAGQHNFLSNTRESVWEWESLEIQIERRHLSTFVLFLCSSLVFVCQRWDLRLAQLSQPFGIPSWVELLPLSLSNKSDWREEDRRELWIKTQAACINDYTSNKSLQGGVVPLHLNHLSLSVSQTRLNTGVCVCVSFSSAHFLWLCFETILTKLDGMQWCLHSCSYACYYIKCVHVVVHFVCFFVTDCFLECWILI